MVSKLGCINFRKSCPMLLWTCVPKRCVTKNSNHSSKFNMKFEFERYPVNFHLTVLVFSLESLLSLPTRALRNFYSNTITRGSLKGGLTTFTWNAKTRNGICLLVEQDPLEVLASLPKTPTKSRIFSMDPWVSSNGLFVVIAWCLGKRNRICPDRNQGTFQDFRES